MLLPKNSLTPGLAQVNQYYADGSCKIIHCVDNNSAAFEVVNLNTVEWKPCSKRAWQFVAFQNVPATTKVNWKTSPNLVDSIKLSVKGYADDIAIISNARVSPTVD